MIIAAICFLVYELYKAIHAKWFDKHLSMLKEELAEGRPAWSGIPFIELAYYIWIFIGLVWFPEWGWFLGVILGLSVLKLWLPHTHKYVIFDSIITAFVLVAGIVYTMEIFSSLH